MCYNLHTYVRHYLRRRNVNGGYMSKTQTAIITVLNLIIAALIAVIWFMPFSNASASPGDDGNGETPGGDEPTVAVHEKLRDASAGAVSDIVRENRLMGSGDESVVSVYNRSDCTFILGNTTVADLDFDEYGGFLCVLNAAGKILGFSYFGERIVCTADIGSGLLVAGREWIYFADYSGEITRVLQLSGAVADMFPLQNSTVAVLSQPNSNSLLYEEYVVVDRTLKSGASTLITESANIEYFDSYIFGDKTVVSAAVGIDPAYGALSFYRFTVGGDASASYYGGTGETKVTPHAVVPYGSGYYALIEKGGMLHLVTVDYEFSQYREQALGFTANGKSRLIHFGGTYFACLMTDGGAVNLAITELSRVRLFALDGVVVDSIIKCGDEVLLLGSGERMTIAVKTDLTASVRRTLDIDGSVRAAYTRKDGDICVVITASGGGALSTPTHGTDVYYAVLKA